MTQFGQSSNALPLSIMENETLLILMEECAEVIQAISKCQRFGLNAVKPSTSKTNKEHLTEELGDLVAMIDILIEQDFIKIDQLVSAKIAKKEKLKKWSNISHSILNK